MKTNIPFPTTAGPWRWNGTKLVRDVPVHNPPPPAKPAATDSTPTPQPTPAARGRKRRED